MDSTTPITSRVTIIIPVYNAQAYLQRCLDSIYAQTFTDYNVIAVNDGSTDTSWDVLKQNAKSHSDLIVINQDNHGQGYARNRALEAAQGEYILFVDSDDYIEPETLKETVALADKSNADFVHFDWKMAFGAPGAGQRVEYFNVEAFSHKSELNGPECDELLQVNNFYSVNNLYRRDFLVTNAIEYGEGYIYEDTIFVVRAANRANKIALLHEPFYVVQMNTSSTTQSGIRHEKHYADYLRSIRQSFDELRPRSRYTTYYLAAYFIEKYIIYYQKRVPHKLRRRYLKGFVDIMGSVELHIPPGGTPKKFLNACIRHQVFTQKKYMLFYLFTLYKAVVLPLRSALLNK